MAISFVFCEGGETSLDRRILEEVLFPTLDTYPQAPAVIPTGGKNQMANFITGYFAVERARDEIALPQYFAFRDRDFDLPLTRTSEAQLRFPFSSRVAYLHRITIENYLIQVPVLFQFLNEQINLRERINVYEEQDVHELLENAAESIYYYAIARHVIGRLKQNQPAIASTWVQNYGILPVNRTQAYCISEVQQFFIEAFEYRNSLTPESIRTTFEEIIGLMPITRFLNRAAHHDNYLTWCPGKDLIAAIEEQLTIRCGHPYTFGDKWWNFALKKFDYNNFPDLIQLRNILNGTSSL